MPLFLDTYVINLDDSKDRMANIKAKADVAGLKIHRWPAVNLKKPGTNLHELPKIGVGKLLYISRGEKINNLGAIGCFLSHRSVLQHLAEKGTATGKAMGYMIMEDDVDIPPDLFERLEEIRPYIPEDWDMIHLFKILPTGYMVNSKVARLSKDNTALRNYGNYAYIVRHESLDKIVPLLEHMRDEVDIQLNQHMDTLNCYIPVPPILKTNQELASKSIIANTDGLEPREDTEDRGKGFFSTWFE